MNDGSANHHHHAGAADDDESHEVGEQVHVDAPDIWPASDHGLLRRDFGRGLGSGGLGGAGGGGAAATASRRDSNATMRWMASEITGSFPRCVEISEDELTALA